MPTDNSAAGWRASSRRWERLAKAHRAHAEYLQDDILTRLDLLEDILETVRLAVVEQTTDNRPPC